jgi:hypothetical protein
MSDPTRDTDYAPVSSDQPAPYCLTFEFFSVYAISDDPGWRSRTLLYWNTTGIESMLNMLITGLIIVNTPFEVSTMAWFAILGRQDAIIDRRKTG